MITRVLGATLLASAIFGGWQWHQANSAIAELATVRLSIAKQVAEATTAARAEEQRRTLRIQEASHAELLARQVAEADAGRARSASVRLRQRADQLAASCAPSNTTAAASSSATESPGDLLAYMQRRIDEAAGGIGEYADSARIAGHLCVSSYGALRQ